MDLLILCHICQFFIWYIFFLGVHFARDGVGYRCWMAAVVLALVYSGRYEASLLKRCVALPAYLSLPDCRWASHGGRDMVMRWVKRDKAYLFYCINCVTQTRFCSNISQSPLNVSWSTTEKLIHDRPLVLLTCWVLVQNLICLENSLLLRLNFTCYEIVFSLHAFTGMLPMRVLSLLSGVFLYILARVRRCVENCT